MHTTRGLALGLAALVGWGLWRAWPRPSGAPALACHPDRLGRNDAGLVVCDGPFRLSAEQALAVGQSLDLSTCAADDLALLSGFGAEAAEAVVLARPDGGFQTWADVDVVEGVGPHRLGLLQRYTVLRRDGGL